MADPNAPPPYPAQQDPGYPPAGYPPPQNPGYPPQPVAPYPPAQQEPEKAGYYPPQPQPGYPPQQQATTTVVVQQPVVQQTVVFRDVPVVVTDSNGQQVTTKLEYRSGMLTWLICCVLFWLLGLWCCAFIPFCIDATKDVYHITPTDGKVVGVYKRL